MATASAKKMKQLQMFDEPVGTAALPTVVSVSSGDIRDDSSTFVQNQALPIHRWFRYSAGFSGAWAQSIVSGAQLRPGAVVFDPFAGAGTTLLAAQFAGVSSIGIDAHPFVHRVAQAKLHWRSDVERLIEYSDLVLANAARLAEVQFGVAPLLLKAYTEPALRRLVGLRDAIAQLIPMVEAESGELLWLALVSILRACSGVGTAPWQYVLPNKTKSKVLDPFEAFRAQIALMALDMKLSQARYGSAPPAEVLLGDARAAATVLPPRSVDLVVTSPPYPNNYDYADATRLEMTFFGQISRWADLQSAVRHLLVRSCSQHALDAKDSLVNLLQTPHVAAIRTELADVCFTLESLRETKAGKKAYHTMVAAYFLDIAKVWQSLSVVMRPGARACFVIGDSAPYGVHVPADRWMRELAEAVGFKFLNFEPIRQRNIKWKNRKHRVPLMEGRLWVERS